MIDKINWSLMLGIVAGFIVIAAAVAQWSEKKKEEKKAAESEMKANEAQAELKQIQLENLKKTNELTDAYKQISVLQTELRNEITGYNSIPLITGVLVNNNFDGSHLDGYVDSERQSRYSGKWTLDFYIQNFGSFPLNNIQLFESRTIMQGRNSPEEIPIQTVSFLRPNDKPQQIQETIIVEHSEISIGYSITVRWKVEYIYFVRMELVGENFTMKESYSYKNVSYTKANDLIAKIKEDLKHIH